MNTATEIVIFTTQKAARSPLLLGGCVAHCFSGYREFRESALAPVAFIIKGTDEAYAGSLLRQIRRDPDYGASLVFIDGSAASADLVLCDGPLPKTGQALLERIGDVQSRARAMRGAGDDQTPVGQLMRFMWLRPGYVLEPIADWRHPRGYHYPALEVMDRSDTDPETWLQQMDREGLLERVALKDRQRECDYCGSSHLSFIDVCPNCRSIDLDQHTALHCFTCGLIAPEQRFAHGGKRICPKCGTQLRHIGTDYDRPLETCVCGSCEHVFVEGEVIARCAVCAHSMPPTALRLRKLYSWRLSGAGRLAAQGGQETTVHGSARQSSDFEQFVSSLDLMLKLAHSQRDFSFTLFGLWLENRAKLEKTLGIEKAARLVDAFVDRLRESLEDADLMVRSDDVTVLFLLPSCDRKRIARLRGAIKVLTARARQQNGAGLSWSGAQLPVAQKTAGDVTAESLLARLRSERGADTAQAA
ncbi:MAG: hypothetical protein ACRESS_11295 [Stenotrophobium sp.]